MHMNHATVQHSASCTFCCKAIHCLVLAAPHLSCSCAVRSSYCLQPSGSNATIPWSVPNRSAAAAASLPPAALCSSCSIACATPLFPSRLNPVPSGSAATANSTREAVAASRAGGRGGSDRNAGSASHKDCCCRRAARPSLWSLWMGMLACNQMHERSGACGHLEGECHSMARACERKWRGHSDCRGSI